MLPAPILPTKLYKPPPPKNRVPRPRLLERLDTGSSARLTLVSAPAGYGKSTLLAAWAQTLQVPTAWLTLDPGDDDLVRFWAHIVAALNAILDPTGSRSIGDEFLAKLAAHSDVEIPALLEALISEFPPNASPCILVLDDFHQVTAAQTQESLFYFLEHLPVGLRMVLATRSDPPWPLARLRVAGQLLEVRAKDLRFTREEATRFLNQVMGLDLGPGVVAELDRRTEGWAAGLQMAALSMRGRADIDGFLKGFTGSHRFVLDYLVEEVLNQQEPAVLDFLLKTAVLDRLSGPLCAALTGDESSPEILLGLEKSNLFLTALDDQRQWYRYHALFSDLLQKQLRSHQPDALPNLHRRASRWFGEAGYPVDSIAHALKTGDMAFISGQMSAHVLAAIQNGEIQRVRGWLGSLPPQVISQHPVLLVAQAWTSARTPTVDTAVELLAQAEDVLSDVSLSDTPLNDEIRQQVSTQIAVLQVVIARARGDSTLRQQEMALAALDQVGTHGDLAAEATLYLRLGFCYLDLGLDQDADRIFNRSYETGLSSANFYAAHAAAYCRMVIARRHGRLKQLDALCRQVLGAGQGEAGNERATSGLALIMQGGLAYEWDHLDQAEALLIRGLALAEQVGMLEILVKGHYSLACVKLAQGKPQDLPDLIALTEQGHPTLKHYAAALQARLNLTLAGQQTDPRCRQAVQRWADTQDLGLRQQSSYDWEMLEKLIYARVLCWAFQKDRSAGGEARLAAVLDFLMEQVPVLKDLGWDGILLELDLVRALVLDTLGQPDAALQALAAALKRAEPQGWVRTFLDEGPSIRELLQSLVAGGESQSTYARRLLESLGGPGPAGPDLADVGLVEPLSERELQVLRMLNTRLSVPEIAAEIHLAPTTVRTHVQHIYQKLGVHNRIEALQRAHELGLL